MYVAVKFRILYAIQYLDQFLFAMRIKCLLIVTCDLKDSSVYGLSCIHQDHMGFFLCCFHQCNFKNISPIKFCNACKYCKWSVVYKLLPTLDLIKHW